MDLNEIVSRNLKAQKTFFTFTRQKEAAKDIPFDAPLYSRGNSPRLTMSIATAANGDMYSVVDGAKLTFSVTK